MNYNYNNWFAENLIILKTQLGLSEYDISVESEKTFLTHERKPNTIYVITKYLASNIEFNTEIQPIQVVILSEENSLEATKLLFNKFAEEWNWKVSIDNTTFIKHQYTKPVVMSNFNEVGFGYRSVLYMSVNLTIMEGVLDVKQLSIDNNVYNPISFSMVYSASLDPQQMPNKYIAESIKKASTFMVSLTIAMTDNALVNKILSIIAETDTTGSGPSETQFGLYGGNENFNFTITLRNNFSFSKVLKLNSAQINTAINQAPSLSLTFMR